MKKILTLLGLICIAGVYTSTAQGTMTLELNDGTQKEGYLRSPFHSTIQYVEMSDEPIGEPTRYPIKEIDRIVLTDLDGNKINFVKEIRYRMFKSAKEEKVNKGRYRTPVLFREEYRGRDSIALLIEDRETEMTIGLKTAPQKERWYYVQLKGEPALRVLGVVTSDDKPEAKEKNFKMFAKRAFVKYPELVQKIEHNDFSINNPVELVQAYEQLVTQ